jgi:hypothetical protein
MEQGKNQGYRSSWSHLSNSFFKVIYSFVYFFIFIGEITKKIFKLIIDSVVFFSKTSYGFIRKQLKKLSDLIINFLKFIKNYFNNKLIRIKKIKISLPEVKIPKLAIKSTFPKISLPKLSLPKITLPKIIIPKINLPKPLIKVIPEKKTEVKKEKKILKKRGRKRNVWKYVSVQFRFFIFGCVLTIVIFSGYQTYFFVKSLPSPENIGKINYPLSSHIYDRNGKLLYEIYREQNRTPIKLKELPKYVYQSAISIEDKDFYKHKGISLISGVLRAIKDMAIRKNLQGGSTITQQLVKSALLTPERTVQRKIKEIILAIWTEKIFTKDEILEMYLNQVPYGGSSYGIEEASKTYFGKSAKDLTLSEATLLAGLPQAPSFYSPYVNPDLAVEMKSLKR